MSNLKAGELIPRRQFLGRYTAAMGWLFLPGVPVSVPVHDKKLRVIAYNIYKGTGYPAGNVKEGTDIGGLIARELALYSPGIINFSEATEEAVVKKIAGKLKMNYVWFPGGGAWPGAIVTRFRISDAENVPLVSGPRPEDLFTRHWGRAVLQISNRRSLIVHSVHLHPFDTPENSAIRQREISEIVKSMEKDIDDNKSIIVMGDFNHGPATPEHRLWKAAGFTDTFEAAGAGEGFTIRVDNLFRRIDYILACGPVAAGITSSRPLSEGAFITNPDDPHSFALSDHAPQLAEFKL